MSKEKKIITLISGLLLVLSFSLLFWYLYSLRDVNYLGSISYSVSTKDWRASDKFMYYWSDSKEVKEANFRFVEWEKDKSISLIYREQNAEPQTVYLHIKKIGQNGSDVKRIPFENYINKPLTIEPEEKMYLTINDSKLVFRISSNRYSKIDAIFVQLSENALLSNTSQYQLKYRYLGVFDGKESHNYTLNLNLQDYNVMDGAYFLKISVRDTAGVITEIYSPKVNIDFGVISRLFQFESPIIGNDGQVISRSEIQLTGNILIETEFLNNKEWNALIQSNSILTLTKDNLDSEKLNIRRLNGDKVNFISLIQLKDKKQFIVEANIEVPNDWYFIYYEDSFVGAFLYQASRRD